MKRLLFALVFLLVAQTAFAQEKPTAFHVPKTEAPAEEDAWFQTELSKTGSSRPFGWPFVRWTQLRISNAFRLSAPRQRHMSRLCPPKICNLREWSTSLPPRVVKAHCAITLQPPKPRSPSTWKARQI